MPRQALRLRVVPSAPNHTIGLFLRRGSRAEEALPRLASPAACSPTTTTAKSSAAAVLVFEILSSLRSGLPRLRFAVQILNLARLTSRLARAASSLTRTRLGVTLRSGIRRCCCRLSARLPACGGRLRVLGSLILRAGSLGLRGGFRARRVH